MNIVARIKFSNNLKNSSSAVGYYSYTNRCVQLKPTSLIFNDDVFKIT